MPQAGQVETNGCIDPGVAITNHPTTGDKVGASPEPKHAAVAIITESKIVWCPYSWLENAFITDPYSADVLSAGLKILYKL